MLYISEMQMLTSWINPPPAVPCKARPAMSIFMFTALAQMIELTKNHATAVRSSGFLPHMSDSFAHSGAAAALASR